MQWGVCGRVRVSRWLTQRNCIALPARDLCSCWRGAVLTVCRGPVRQRHGADVAPLQWAVQQRDDRHGLRFRLRQPVGCAVSQWTVRIGRRRGRRRVCPVSRWYLRQRCKFSYRQLQRAVHGRVRVSARLRVADVGAVCRWAVQVRECAVCAAAGQLCAVFATYMSRCASACVLSCVSTCVPVLAVCVRSMVSMVSSWPQFTRLVCRMCRICAARAVACHPMPSCPTTALQLRWRQRMQQLHRGILWQHDLGNDGNLHRRVPVWQLQPRWSNGVSAVSTWHVRQRLWPHHQRLQWAMSRWPNPSARPSRT